MSTYKTSDFKINDSGKRQSFDTGSVRDTDGDKPDYTLISHHANTREAIHLVKGAGKYGRRNWELGQPVSRFLASAFRHLEQFRSGKRDEDHLAAVRFNVDGIMHMEEEVALGNLPQELLDLPFYKKETKTPDVKEIENKALIELADAAFVQLVRACNRGGLGYTILTAKIVLTTDLTAIVGRPVTSTETLDALDKLVEDARACLYAINGSEIRIYFPSCFTTEEVRERIRLATGEDRHVYKVEPENRKPKIKSGSDDDWDFDDDENGYYD